MAKLSFSNAYQINTATTAAAKEANSADFIFTALNVTRIDDKSGGVNFSGNDVVVELEINGQIYYGWISRPIKSGGVVRGFYFWTDPQFTSLAAATADGNADGDGNSADNFGFVLVVDQAWFNALPLAAGGTLKNAGTSSDRVDSGLNALLPVNSAPAPMNDSASFLEDGGAQSGNVLANDSDANGDGLAVTGFSIGGVAGTLGVARAIAGVGSFTLHADGAYSFTPAANYAGSAPLISYSVADGRGGSGTASLSISVAQVNDAPSGADRTLSARENTAYTFSAADFGFTDSADSVANSLLSVRITTLPDALKGVLTLNGAPVAAGSFIAAADITRLKFVAAADSSGAAFASFTFQVRDNGGGVDDTDLTPNTITFNVSDVNSAPAAVADSAGATEAGGAGNAVPGVNPGGNLLANDTDPDAGDTLSVASASGSGAATAVASGTPIAGAYGTLSLSSDGSYLYTLDNSNSAVQALRSAGDTLSDTFSYTVRDAAGLNSTASLSVTIAGSNDGPAAAGDFNFAVASNLAAARLNPAGNVLVNDSDADRGDTLVVTRASSGATLSGTIVTISGGTTVQGSEGRTYTGFSTQGAGNIGGVGATVSGTGVPAGTTVASVVNVSGTKTVTFANAYGGVAALDGVTTITVNGNAFTIETRSAPSTTIIAISGASGGTISSGMAVAGTGIEAGTTVSSVAASNGYSFVTLSKAVTGALGTDVSFGSSGTSIAGAHGTLVLQQDGSYTYTVTNPTPTAATETFTYEIADAAGLKSTAQLDVQIIVSSVAPPDAAADSAAIAENAVSTSVNVLSNDTQASGTKAVSDAWSATASAMTAVTAGGVTLTGLYGSLLIAQDGSASYTPDNANALVNALTSGQALSDTFSYRMGSNAVGYDVAALTITINGANDAPAALVDSASAREAGGVANGTAGFSPAGNVLANDTDPDSGDVRSVAMAGTTAASTAVGSGTSAADGLQIAGTYGTLHLGADGSYTYAVDNANATVNALGAASPGLTDTFTYQMRDSAGATSSATLVVAVGGANDAPLNALPASATVAEGASAAIAGISVADVDDTVLSVQLTVASGTLAIGTLGAAAISAGANGSATLTLTGSAASINAALATFSYQGASQFSGTDTLVVLTTDAAGLAALDTLDITVTPDNRALTVSSPTVNEASAYAVFAVGGAAGQNVTLVLEASGTALMGGDFGAGIEYYDGAAWQPYSGNAVAIPAGGSLLVRTAILADQLDEGAESFSLKASNKAGAASTGVATIVDNGTGLVYSGGVTGGVPDSSASGLDDDRALTVSSVAVNESSPYAVFTLAGAAGQQVTLSLVNGSASNADHGTVIEYYDGAAWQAHGSSLTLPAGGSVFLRTAISADNVYEGPETFALVAANLSGRSFVGNALVSDDGTGLKYPGTITGGAIDSSSAGLDNDLSVSVTAFGPVNEASAYAMFTVTATAGEVLTLTLSGSGAMPAATGGFSMEFSTNGSTWTAYDASTQPVVPLAGVVYVRAAIASEQDTFLEGSEGFALTASIGSGSGASGSAASAIVDDGTGSKYDGTLSGGLPVAVTTGLDQDTVTDTIAPTIAISSNVASLGAGQTATLTFTLSEASADFVQADISVAGGTLSNFAGSGASYSATFTPAAGSTTPAVISVASNRFTDAAGNANADGADANNTVSMAVNTVVADTIPPSIAITSNRTSLGAGQSATITFTLSEPSLTFGAADIAVAGGVLSNFSGSGASYSAIFTPAPGSTAAAVISVASAAFTDAAGNANTDGADADNTLSMAVNTVIADTSAPAISISVRDASLRPGESTSVSFTLSEASSSFGADDVEVSGGSLSGFSGSGASYSATFTAGNGSVASASISVASARFADAAGNANTSGALAFVQVARAPLSAPSVTIVEDANNDGRLSSGELQGEVDVAIGLPSGVLAGDVLTVSDGANVHTIVISAEALAAGRVAASFPAPAPGANIGVTASITGSNGVIGPAAGDSAQRGSGTPFAITAISTDTGIVGDLITTDNTLVLSGTAESGTVVKVMLGGALLGTTVAVNGAWSFDNTANPLPNGDNVLSVSADDLPGQFPTIVVRIFSADLNPDSDDGANNTDHRTSVTSPDFILKATGIMASGDIARLVDASGTVIGSSPITAANLASGQVNVLARQLDDGTYTFMAQILDASGQVKVQDPVSVTIVTDQDGVRPSVELSANNGDFNRDGVADWQQNNLAHLPLGSLDAFLAGINAPDSSFGAIMAGAVSVANPGAAVVLDAGAQLLNVGVSALPAALPANFTAATPMLEFSVTGYEGQALRDIAPLIAGTQTRIVIDLPAGVQANAFMKWDAAAAAWFSFNDDQNLATFDDGATLLDTNGDGLIDRLVVTLTDGGRGDEDGAANGVIVDPGLLAFKSENPVYSVLLAGGDRFYTTSAAEAAKYAAGTGNIFEGARFDSLSSSAGGQHIYASWQQYTRDWYFGADKQAAPYICYERVDSAAGFMAASAGQNIGQKFHLYLDGAGMTQLVTQAEAAALGLAARGYVDKGAQFSTTTTSKFVFDAEGYLVANKGNADIQAFVRSLAAKFQHSSDAGFVEAVEQHYLAQVKLVGLPHGGDATAGDLNIAFGTNFFA